jgi:hypothetical protein
MHRLAFLYHHVSEVVVCLINLLSCCYYTQRLVFHSTQLSETISRFFFHFQV